MVWYGEKRNNRVVGLDPETGERVHMVVTTPGATVRDLVMDEERGRLWLPLSDRGRICLVEVAR